MSLKVRVPWVGTPLGGQSTQCPVEDPSTG